MTSLIKALNSPITRRNPVVLYSAVRHHWNKDFKPAPYPKTEEERIKAAKKYGLLPEEYKPFPDDGSGYGDYPDIPIQSADSKDNFYPYDFPELKRNFNEVVPKDFDRIGEDRYDESGRTRFTVPQMYASFGGCMAVAFFLYYFFEDKKMFRPVLPKQYPRDGTHYTFETE